MTEKRAKAKKPESEIGKQQAAYTPTSAECDQVGKYLDRRASRAPAPRIKVQQGPSKSLQVEPDHPDPAIWSTTLHAVFGTSDFSFADGLLGQL